ncbi:PAS domain S-box protein [Aliikangiella marina]|uniref:histidine kinase n=1 Tax=Aliikangiella marina TaxID=1712262 RepID=A0A545THY6_9GAMM|nr:PAS-domain containing protein [Aliikangiella marina]TQV76808.1 PAS domain S-box protein [Aliikangiella marina]
MISTFQIILIAFIYVVILFFIAYYSDKNKPAHFSGTRKALVYSFSIAIYCTSWTFYGAVGSASDSGWSYLPIYLGPILVYTLGWPLLKRFVTVGNEQNTTSISDFIAARYGKSQVIAAIVTIIAIVAIIPYIALQLKAITMSIEVFDAQQNLFDETHYNAFFITLLLIVFSVLFGTRNIDVTEHQYGMMNAIAFESIIKLIAFLSIGIYALYSIFDGPVDLINQLQQSTDINQFSFSQINWETTITVTILAAVAIFCLPRQFHVTVVEYHQEKDLKYARIIFPIYLSLISLFVIPIVVAGNQYFAGSGTPADTYILALPIALQESTLSALVFIGGLSAATGMVIVATVALSTMVSNDLALPVLLKQGQFRNQSFTRRMLIIRRLTIAVSLLLSFGFYRLLEESQSLASIGYLSFTAVLQFAPALFIGLFWSRATHQGAIAGLLSGTVFWFILTWIPTINGEDLLSNKNSYTGLSILSESLLISTIFNVFSLVFVSKLSTQTLPEKIQAYAYTRSRPKSISKKEITKESRQITVGDLKTLAAAIVGHERMIAAFESFASAFSDNDLADSYLVDQTEKILSTAIGASSARVVLLSALKEKGFSVEDVINLLSSTSQALKFNRQLVETTMDNISQGISVSDSNKNIVAWNSSYQRLMNYPEGFLQIGMPVASLIRFNAERGYCGPGEVQEHVDKRLEHLSSGLSYRFERERNDGMVIEIVGNPLPEGGYVTTYTDISEYKSIEAALKENERNTALYTDNSPAQLAYLDKNLTYAFVNKAFAKHSGLEKSEIIGQPVTKVLSAEELEFKQPYIAAAMMNQKQQFEWEDSSDDSRYYLVTYIPNLNEKNEVDGIYTISQDISNRRKAELALKEINVTLEQRVAMRTDELHSTVKALEAVKQEAEKANKSKSRFLAAASHDLLQPFNAARLFSEMLKSESTNMSEAQAELVEKTDQSLAVAENIIRSLVDISKLDSGTVHPKTRTFDVYELLDSIEKQFSSFATNKNLKFKVFKRHLYVKSDPELLYRIVQNFVSNAIRYTQQGGVIVGLQKRKSEIRLSVCDTGIGIKEADQQDIFNEFKRIADPSLGESESGLGLGLSISERLASVLDHKIDLRSNYGRGTRFSIYVTATSEQSTQAIQQAQQPSTDILKGINALCVDNEKPITDAMTMLLERWKCNVKSANSAEEIDIILEQSFIPDIMLVDYQLEHGKTGLAFIETMREKTGIEIPAIIITADHTPEVESKIKQFGVPIIRKPVKPAILRVSINSILRNSH